MTAAPTLEYTCSICTCGRELSTIYYLITARQQFLAFACEQGFPDKTINNIGFTTLEEATTEHGLGFCCLMNLRFGTRVPVSIVETTNRERVSSHKYPDGLPGPLSHEKTLTWF